MISILLHVLGLDNGSGPWYLWWSGAFPDVVIFVAVISWWRRHTCHVGRCWRWARHPVGGTDFRVCRRHHPDDDPTHEDILVAHMEAKR